MVVELSQLLLMWIRRVQVKQCRVSFALKFRPFDKVERCFDIVAGVDGALMFVEVVLQHREKP